MMLQEAAPAKVNLYLHVVGRRADGYHLLDSLAVLAGVGDVLRAAPSPAGADALSLSVTGPFAAGLDGEADNLVLRAARALAAATGVTAGAVLELEKHLPVASGIGGGSADAAAALRLLARLWRVEVSPGLALALGADVPVCLAGQPARMQGVGEVLSAVPALPRCGLVLVNPGVAVPTPAVFRARQSGFSDPAMLPRSWPDAAALAATLAGLRNDLQSAAITLAPAIGPVLTALESRPDCLLARMSGSGATCFGLFADVAAAQGAAAALARPGWFVWGGGLAGSAGAA